jgi:16S rRNA processing protein RimM
MKKELCYHLGKITKPHGLKGEMQIWLDVDEPENYVGLEALYLDQKGELVPYIVEEIQIRGKKSIIKIENVNKIEDTEKLVNLDIFLPLKKLPKLRGNRFYYHEVIGYSIFDGVNHIGELKSIYESTGQDLFAIDKEEIEILIPIVDSFLKGIDHEEKKIVLSLPEGLIDVYLNPEK